MTALLFGSISSLADTSELQRESFNAAFAEHGLDWRWDRADYQQMLRGNGGADRIAQYAADRGDEVDAAAVHETKSEKFRESLRAQGVSPRPGVAEAVIAAHGRGDRVALVTTTSPDNVEALLGALQGLGRDDFDLVVDKTQVDAVKPDPAAYAFALGRLDVTAAEAVAVEDNVGGVQAAKAAGVRVIAFPNANTADHDFSEADEVTDALQLEDLGR